MRHPDPRLPVGETLLSTLRRLPSPRSKAAAPFYERPWKLRTTVPSDPAECGCLERGQSELMHLLTTLESYRVEP